MKNQLICGDTAKLMENLGGPLFSCFASINGFICKIVTKIEILALVLLQLNTNFKGYRPFLGDIPY